eukprot:s4073_g3.t1
MELSDAVVKPSSSAAVSTMFRLGGHASHAPAAVHAMAATPKPPGPKPLEPVQSEAAAPPADLAAVWVHKAGKGSEQWVRSCTVQQLEIYRLRKMLGCELRRMGKVASLGTPEPQLISLAAGALLALAVS